jgi:hypothetical protein
VYAAPQVYAAPPVTTGYYSAPVVSQPIYNYAPGSSGYSGYGYGSYASGYPGYGYGGLGYRAARRVAIHNARWH